MFPKKLSIKLKLLFLGAGTLLAVYIIVLLVSARELKSNLLQEKHVQVKEMVTIALGALEYYHEMEKKGMLSPEDARLEAALLLKTMRHGDNLKNYFWITDLDSKMIMHPLMPELEGMDLSDTADPDGFFLFLEFSEIGRTKGSDFVTYRWQYYDDISRFELKLSYAELFRPWGWIIGTGIYLDDLDQAVKNISGKLAVLFFITAFITVLIYIRFTMYLLGPVQRGAEILDMISSGNSYNAAVEEKDLGRSDEAGQLSRGINSLIATENALIESVSRFRELVQNARAIILEWDSDGIITFINEYGEKCLGYSLQELSGKNVVETIVPDTETSGRDLVTMIEEICRAPDKYKDNVNENLTKDGRRVWIRWSNRAVNDSNGNLKGILSIGTDITEEKNAEEEREKLYSQIIQMQKMESVGRLAGGVAHDFNNILSVIIGHSELVLDQLAEPDPLYKSISEIHEAAQRSAGLTRQLLAFARKQAIKPVVMDLNKTVSGMLKMLERLIGENIELIWKPADNLHHVNMDPSQLDQILANLTVNARDSISDTGIITIETKNAVFDREYCRIHNGSVPGEYVMLAVTDSGAGMEKDVLEHIFEPFFTTKKSGEGTGLGLSMIYGIVKQNNGFINVYSEPGTGTCFKLYFPAVYNEASEKEDLIESRESVISAAGGETILFVEDEESILNLGHTFLSRQGYRVLPANSPEKALKLSGEYQEEIHLLVTDVIMPGMNGKVLKEKISEMRPEIKTIFMSGYTSNTIVHHGVIDDNINFIQKPFSLKDMASIVRKVLG